MILTVLALLTSLPVAPRSQCSRVSNSQDNWFEIFLDETEFQSLHLLLMVPLYFLITLSRKALTTHLKMLKKCIAINGYTVTVNNQIKVITGKKPLHD